MGRKSHPELFLSAQEKEQVDKAIKQAEKNTSAEIKLVLVRYCWGSLIDKALGVFQDYNLHATEDHNCVLIMMVLTNREFIIYGDQGIHEKVGENFWIDCRNVMQAEFKDDRFGDGLAKGINRIGEKLKTYFPYKADDVNEIKDEIIYEQ